MWSSDYWDTSYWSPDYWQMDTGTLPSSTFTPPSNPAVLFGGDDPVTLYEQSHG